MEMKDWSWLWTAREERYHHPYSPSQLQNLEACPHYKNRTSVNERAVAGTLGHKVVETEEDDSKLSDKDFVAAAECLDFVEQRRQSLENNFPGHPVVEQKEIYLLVDDCRFDDCQSTTAGWVDHLILVQQAKYAELIDWKFGFWAVESADNNLQGIAYSLGVFKKYPKVDRVRFWFKQPHLEYTTDHTFERSDIPALYLRVQAVVSRARLARQADDFKTARAYVPVCNFCDNLGRCPIGLELALKIAKKFYPVEFPEDITPTKVLDPKNTKLALNLASVAKIWAEAFRRQVNERVIRMEAEIPEGMHMQPMPGRREITDLETFERIAKAHVPEEIYKKSLSATFGPIEEYINDAAPRGHKKAAVEAFQAELESSSAVTRGDPYSFLKVSNKKQNAE